jgi:Protein of unknown function (DUF3014)
LGFLSLVYPKSSITKNFFQILGDAGIQCYTGLRGPSPSTVKNMKTALLWLIPLILISAFAVLRFWPESEHSLPKPPAAPAPAAKPAIRHPVESVNTSKNSLPPLAESDGPLSEALATLLGDKLPEFVYLKNIIHRIVATVDNFPRDHVAPRLMPVSPVPGLPIIDNRSGDLYLSLKNAERYQRYVRLAEAIPTDASVAVYARFYPLFQEQYENLGYPDKYFNDRVVEVIDHLLATPEIEEPLRLIQPRVLYEFADPKLEKLSAGQKILLRMGRTNQLKLKAKLREIRDRLVSMAP